MQSAGCYHAPNDSVRALAYGGRVKQRWVQLADIQQEAWLENP
jgi:hypothetical protein